MVSGRSVLSVTVSNCGLPPLRKRHDDIAEPAMAFVEEATAKSGRSRMVLSQGAMERLEDWPWKGNVREQTVS